MTVIREPRLRIVPAHCDEPMPRRGRLIGVGVHDYRRDSAAIEWALADSVVGADAVLLVHAYIPVRLDGCTWDPKLRARDERYMAARHIVAHAVQRAASRHTDRVCGGEAIAGLPEDVLLELSDVVDLIVIGDDSERSEDVRKISRRVQDRARCPVVCVPNRSHHLRGRPVTVVADERGLPEEALAFGAEAALRRGVGLVVSRAWSALHEPPPDNATWVAEQQEELDGQLAHRDHLHLRAVALAPGRSHRVLPGRDRPIAPAQPIVDLLDLPGPGRSALPVGGVRSSNGDA